MSSVLTVEELRVLSACAFISGSMLMAPGERVAGVATYGISAALFLWARVRQRRQSLPVRPSAADTSGAAP